MYGYAHEAGVPVVWIDSWLDDRTDRPWPEEARGVVCERHGLSLTAPRGWNLVDRRDSVPRLFVPRPLRVAAPSVEPANSAAREADTTAAQRRRRIAALPTPQLFIDLDSVPSIADEVAPEVAPEVDARGAAAEEPSEPSGPLLRRAFARRNTGRHDASKELMRPTTHHAIDESA